MRTLSQHEKRTILIGGLVVAAFILLVGASRTWQYFGIRRADYERLVKEAQTLQQQVQLSQDKAAVIQKLMEGFRLDPSQLSRTSLVAEASAAIQQTAIGGGLQLGPVRETPGRMSSRELGSIQLEGSGPVPAVTGFLGRLESVGYPVIIDTVQLTSDPRPGMVKMTLTLVILDFEQWKEPPHA